MTRTRWAHRCQAHRQDGRPCQAYAIVGGFVCRKHGGAAPQVRNAAVRRLAEQRRVRALQRSYAVSQATKILDEIESCRRTYRKYLRLPGDTIADEDNTAAWLSGQPPELIAAVRTLGRRQARGLLIDHYLRQARADLASRH